MGRRALVLALGLLIVGASSWGLAGENERKRAPRKRPEPVSTADYMKAVQELLDAAGELEKPGAEAKAQELRDKVKAACANLRLGGRGLDKMLELENKPLAGRLKGFAANSLRSKAAIERKKLLASKPELADEHKKLQEKKKALEAEEEAFNQKLRPQSPEIDQMEKMREALAAESKGRDEEARAKRKAEMDAKRKAREGKGERKKKEDK